MNPIEIGISIRKARINKVWTLAKVAKENGVDVGTLSRIERGMPYKDETVLKIAEYLGLNIENLGIDGSTTINIGYGALLWASPLILLELSNRFQMSCWERPTNEKYKQSQLDFEKDTIHTAHELITYLRDGKITVAFMPHETADEYEGAICRVGYICNTSKNGAWVVAISKNIGKKKNEITKEEIIKKVRDEKAAILYHEGTIGKVLREKYFQDTDLDYVTVTNKTIFREQVSDRLKYYFEDEKKELVLFIGWDTSVINLQSILSEGSPSKTAKYSTQLFDGWQFEFSKPDDEIFNVRFDLITNKENLKNTKFIRELYLLFHELESQIKFINKEKNDPRSKKVREIAKFLDLEDNLISVRSCLRKTTFELMYYPEFLKLITTK